MNLRYLLIWIQKTIAKHFYRMRCTEVHTYVYRTWNKNGDCVYYHDEYMDNEYLVIYDKENRIRIDEMREHKKYHGIHYYVYWCTTGNLKYDYCYDLIRNRLVVSYYNVQGEYLDTEQKLHKIFLGGR